MKRIDEEIKRNMMNLESPELAGVATRLVIRAMLKIIAALMSAFLVLENFMSLNLYFDFSSFDFRVKCCLTR